MPLAELLCSISVYQRVLQRPSPRRKNHRALQPCPARETEPNRISRWSLNSLRFEEKSFLGPGNKTLPGSCSLPLPQLSFRWLSGNDSTCQCQCQRRGFGPWVGKIPWRKKRQPTPAFLTRLYSSRSHKESATTYRSNNNNSLNTFQTSRPTHRCFHHRAEFLHHLGTSSRDTGHEDRLRLSHTTDPRGWAWGREAAGPEKAWGQLWVRGRRQKLGQRSGAKGRRCSMKLSEEE